MKAVKPINMNKKDSNPKIDKASLQMDCDCGGTIKGEGWIDRESYEVLKFDFLNCKKCNWTQLS